MCLLSVLVLGGRQLAATRLLKFWKRSALTAFCKYWADSQKTENGEHDEGAFGSPSHVGSVEEEHREKSAKNVGNKIEACAW